MSRRTRGVVACAAALALLPALAGCTSSPPDIPDPADPDLTAAQDADCRALVDGLPDSLAEEKATAVTGATAYGAAWGDPPIVLTCGVDAVDITDAPPCTTVDGVGWVVQESDEATTFTADGYRPRVQVVVPDHYDQPATLLTGLADVVRQHTTVDDRCVF